MIAWLRRPQNALWLAGLVGLTLAVSLISLAQEESSPASEAPQTDSAGAPAEEAGAPAPEANQEGLPPGLVVDPGRLDAEEKRLQEAEAYLALNAPPGGIGGLLSRAGSWFGRITSGKKSPQAITVQSIVENASDLNAAFVTVEGLYRSGETQDTLVAGEDQLAISSLPQTTVDGFGKAGPDGLPALVTGTVLLQEPGPILHATEVTPAPTLTLVRLARVKELQESLQAYGEAVDLYQRASRSIGPGLGEWSGFAMAHGGHLAEVELRDRKKAVSLYTGAWELEGRIKSGKASPGSVPVTWVQGDDGTWSETTLREAVGEPLDALSQGFWYKFVDAFVVISGNNAGIGLILMAIVTRMLLYPLTKKQIQSSRAMQALQPEIKELQAKHGSDKQKFQEEFWKLCRANKVNPFGGCVPLLIQLPLLWMVYRGIRAYSVQLADHSFLWIPSLADPDILLLVLYTVSMIAFQKLTMKNQPIADPQQQQQQNMMVWMMPIMMFMFFQTIASGFILYWLGTNLIYLPQQYLGMRQKSGEGEQDGRGERVTTIPPGPGAGANPERGSSLVDKVKAWLSPRQPAPDEGRAPPSYEQKQRDKKKRPSSGRRRSRR